MVLSLPGALMRPLRQIGTTLRAQARTILPTQGRYRHFQQQGLANRFAQVQPPTVVKQHVIVTLERFLLAARRRPGPFRVHHERRFQRQIELPQAAHALEVGPRQNGAPHRHPLAELIDLELAANCFAPFRLRESDVGSRALGLHPVNGRAQGGEIEDETGHTHMGRPKAAPLKRP